jgi:5-oxoprolinase (ATP-hydrolysing)
MSGRWEFWIDRGGTFTDCLGKDPRSGKIHVAKVLSSDRAPLVGIRKILGLSEREAIAPCDVRIGTTLATNALLERKGAPSALVITRGFRDLLEIGTQARPQLFDLRIEKPEKLYRTVLEVDSRADPMGNVLFRSDPEQVLGELGQIRESGVTSAAIVVIHAYVAPELERELGALAARAGFEHVALSHEVANELGMLARGDTAMLDAYVTPLLREYVRMLAAELPGSNLSFMQSSGGLTDASRFRGPAAILSGPAGGIIASARVAEASGITQVIGFDMGGTSTDVSRFDGEYERNYETEVAQVRVRAPMLAIHTVAAGGGSLCRFDGRRMTVGPESAGADPGPLCYGNPRSDGLTLTDLNLLLGRLLPEHFPIVLDHDRPREALERVTGELRASGMPRRAEEVAEGFLRIADQNMAEAIRRVSVARGYDVRNYAIVVFGGAGGQHACAVARLLGVRRLLFHPLAGVLSALGIGLADSLWHGAADAGRSALSDAVLSGLEPVMRRLIEEGRAVLEAEGFDAARIATSVRVDLRYAGTETSLSLPLLPAAELLVAFEARHSQVFGYSRPGHVLEVVEVRVEAVGKRRALDAASEPTPDGVAGEPLPVRHAALWLDGRLEERVPVFERAALRAGQRLSGPALIVETTSTIVLESEFELEVRSDGLLVAVDRRSGVERGAASGGPALDPVLLEIMGNLYMSIAEQMGHILQRTALSTNIRERLDFSCAVFDAAGGLVANAPHIPVHLGAMGESVRAVMTAHPDLEPGDVFATNDPALGGSHLPDVTVVTPVHDAKGELLFFTASRGHHADIGGITPGSMPPFSSSLAEEGVVFRALRIVHRGTLERGAILDTLKEGPYPARNPLQNLADLEAQIAANRGGARLLGDLVDRHGLAVVRAYMQHVQDDAAAKVSAEIARLPPGEHRFEDALDDGTPIVVTLEVAGGRLAIDFTGTGDELPTNLNAPRAVTVAAVIYVLRSLVGAPIPLNAGCLRPVDLLVPRASVLDPRPDRPVAGGNVETSQRIVDVLLAAVGRAAASQGTMNNLTFGDAVLGYYETIAGGAGAGPGFAGADAVHTHMTNTRITDPEVLESRFPVRLVEFAVRRGSGGRGRFRGGDGVSREIEFLRPMQVSILSERRSRAPFGLAGGEPGACGRNTLDGVPLPAKASFAAGAGSRLRIDTPGGGGYGAAD